MKTVKLRLTENIYKRLQKLKTDDGFEEQPLEKWVEYFVRNTHLVEPIVRRVMRNTRRTLAMMWMQNLGENLHEIRKSNLTLRSIASAHPVDTPALVVGAGPSVNGQLDVLAHDGFNGTIIATDKMLIPLLRRGIPVDYVVSVDGHQTFIAEFYDDDVVELNREKLKVLLVLQVAPSVVKMCKRRKLKVHWFHTMQDNPMSTQSSTRNIIYMTMSKKNPLGVVAVPSGGNVGTTALAIAIDVLKHTKIGLIGFNFGYIKGEPIENTPYYSTILRSYLNLLNDKTLAEMRTATAYAEFYHPIFKTVALTDTVFDGYRAGLYELLSNLKSPLKLYNATEGGTLYNPSLFKCVTFDSFLKQTRNNTL